MTEPEGSPEPSLPEQGTSAEQPAGDVHDTGYAAPRWAFDGEVTRVFEDMLERSIPQYETMRRLVFDIACCYVQRKTDIVDLGCSRGEALAPLVYRYGAHNRFIGVDVSEPMLEAARRRYAGYIACGVVDIRNLDLRKTYPSCLASVTLAVLCIQFTPIEHRLRILRDIYKNTRPGGAFILVEKVLGATADLDALLVKRYHELKAQNGYTQDEIERKRLSLEGVLVPTTARWNEDLLRTAGFAEIDVFWRTLNFCGWVAVKAQPE
jgi:tRNA (cmo5U34)-methyltransferase